MTLRRPALQRGDPALPDLVNQQFQVVVLHLQTSSPNKGVTLLVNQFSQVGGITCREPVLPLTGKTHDDPALPDLYGV